MLKYTHIRPANAYFPGLDNNGLFHQNSTLYSLMSVMGISSPKLLTDIILNGCVCET